jgi:hypothetical protein
LAERTQSSGSALAIGWLGPGRHLGGDVPSDAAGFWTLDRTTITGRSGVILRHIQQPFHPMIVRSDDLELVHQSLRTLEPPHTHKFPRVNAQDSKLGTIQPWDVKDFLRLGRGWACGMGELLAAGRQIYSELKNICVWVKHNAGMGSLYRSQH